MSNVLVKHPQGVLALYVDGKLVCTHDRRSDKADVALSLKQRFGDAEYSERFSKEPRPALELEEVPVPFADQESEDSEESNEEQQ